MSAFGHLSPLIEEFGARNVESAMEFVRNSCDSRGLKVLIKPTPEMIRAVLEAVHGRLGVGEIRLKGLPL